MASGVATPTSSTTTLSCPPSPDLKTLDVHETVFSNPRVSASNIIEWIASRASISSAVYIYDVAQQVGFGALTKLWSQTAQGVAPIIEPQTRAGAGLGLVGRLSEEGTSKDVSQGSILTAYITLNGLASMAPSLSYLPPAASKRRLVIQVPAVAPVGDSLSLLPSLSTLGSVLALLPKDTLVLLSATPQEAVDFSTLAYAFGDSHAIHIFDQHSGARETGRTLRPVAMEYKPSDATIAAKLASVGYSAFEYTGDSNAETVIVLLNGPLALAAKTAARLTPGLGVVTVKVLRPWDEAALIAALPSSVKTIHVIDEVPNLTTQGPLYVDVFGSTLGTSIPARVKAHRVLPQQAWDMTTSTDSIVQLISDPTNPLKAPSAIDVPSLKRLIFFSTPASNLRTVPHLVESTFDSSSAISSRLLTDHDLFSKKGGVTASRILLSEKDASVADLSFDLLAPLGEGQGHFELLGILDHTLFKSHDLLKYASPGAAILIAAPWSVEELASNLPSNTVAQIHDKALRVYLLNVADIMAHLPETASSASDAIQSYSLYLAFLRLFLSKGATPQLVQKLSHTSFDGKVNNAVLTKLNDLVWSSLVEAVVPPVGSDKAPASLKAFDFNAIAAELEESADPSATVDSWHVAARHLLFPAAFEATYDVDPTEQNPALHPEIPDRTYLITCTVNRRLTPLEYDRNVFHLEFDTSGTGLKYEVGEALGVHGWNDYDEVIDFCSWYGVDPNRLITIPVVSGEGPASKMHTRTVLQALQQQIDLFGRPPKSFYSDLAVYATKKSDKYALQFIGSPEGSSTFKKMGEKDTVTFADVLQMYPSARPGIEVLCQLVGDIKPRHYSIASAQSAVGDRVDLLVVTVDWVTPSGSPRYGQCTRYLAGLKVGQKVTVSIKPSVMKLPPSLKQPLILSGLGTGAAPFRAFLQHRAKVIQDGETDVGPIYYYFGSRHQSSEYLYGEEIEAFLLDGVITKAGLAFSRDGPKKVYIQHKMLDDAQTLAGMLQNDQGVFYLCGPTWPVPDVFEALVNALIQHHGMTKESAGEYLEQLKEEERYVLEVY